jgi:very-short-patch-repair endonuclease
MPNERDKSRPDAAISRLAANQHGVVTTRQLLTAGVLRSGIADRVAAGRLHPIHRGVYAVGHRKLSDRGRWMAAVLACGDGAVLSHTSAAELWGIRRPHRRRSDAEPAPHVTVPSTAVKRRRDGIVLHRSSTLIPAFCTQRDGIPVTNPARTLADLLRTLSPAQVAAARREAEFLGLAVNEPESADRARTDLEQLFSSLLRRHRLPQPEVNVKIDRYEVDFLWPDHRLIVELDGWDAHRTRSAFEEDRARDTHLATLGYDVLRFTWRQIERDPRGVARTVRSLLRAV